MKSPNWTKVCSVHFWLAITARNTCLVTHCSITLFRLSAKDCSLKCLWSYFLEQRARAYSRCFRTDCFKLGFSVQIRLLMQDTEPATVVLDVLGTYPLQHISSCPLASWYDAQLELEVWMKSKWEADPTMVVVSFPEEYNASVVSFWL